MIARWSMPVVDNPRANTAGLTARSLNRQSLLRLDLHIS